MAPGGQWLPSYWQTRGLLSNLLLPLALLYGGMAALRRMLFVRGLLSRARLTVPVIVVGNITVGGAGKTPLVIALIEALRQAGFTPGVVSRGYRGNYSRRLQWAEVESADALFYGDEIVLVQERSGVPAAVGRDRARAARGLLARHPELDAVVCDDGLQHYRLERDVEVAVFDDRGVGNARLLPAGPLREPIERLRGVDALVCNSGTPSEGPGQLARDFAKPSFGMRLEARCAYLLAEREQQQPLARFAGSRVLAAAGIGAPERFFATLAAAGLTFARMPLADHYAYRVSPFAGRSEEFILITEKDAVKCRQFNDARLWVVAVDAVLEDGLVALVLEKIRARK